MDKAGDSILCRQHLPQRVEGIPNSLRRDAAPFGDSSVSGGGGSRANAGQNRLAEGGKVPALGFGHIQTPITRSRRCAGFSCVREAAFTCRSAFRAGAGDLKNIPCSIASEYHDPATAEGHCAESHKRLDLEFGSRDSLQVNGVPCGLVAYQQSPVYRRQPPRPTRYQKIFGLRGDDDITIIRPAESNRGTNVELPNLYSEADGGVSAT